MREALCGGAKDGEALEESRRRKRKRRRRRRGQRRGRSGASVCVVLEAGARLTFGFKGCKISKAHRESSHDLLIFVLGWVFYEGGKKQK